MDDGIIQGRLAFLKNAGALKEVLRTAHTVSGRRESTAEHSWRLCLMALAFEDGLGELDLHRVLSLCVVHDLAEAVTGDVPATSTRQLAGKQQRERLGLEKLTAGLDRELAQRILALWEEYEEAETGEARAVKAMDKLETIMQHNQGRNPEQFDYAFNLEYGRAYTSSHVLFDRVRTHVDRDTETRRNTSPSLLLHIRAMPIDLPPALPSAHRAFIDRALAILPGDSRLVGLAAAGSFLTGKMDEFSDLDLVIVTTPDAHKEILAKRERIAQSLGKYLQGFTGEHVGEPRLFIALYDAPLLHVDLKFVSLDDVHQRVEDPAILWERDGLVSSALTKAPAIYPAPDLAWINDRFWIWMHYGAMRIGRGELFEAIDLISYVRSTVLGPLALQRARARPQGVRRIETHDPVFAEALRATIPAYDADDCYRALAASIALYQSLRDGFGDVVRNDTVENAVITYIDGLRRSL